MLVTDLNHTVQSSTQQSYVSGANAHIRADDHVALRSINPTTTQSRISNLASIRSNVCLLSVLLFLLNDIKRKCDCIPLMLWKEKVDEVQQHMDASIRDVIFCSIISPSPLPTFVRCSSRK